MKTLTDVLPYDAVTNDMIVSFRKRTLTAIVELHVSTWEAEEVLEDRHQRIMQLILDMPENSIISFYYCKSIINASIPEINLHKNDIINYMEKKRNEKLCSMRNWRHQVFMSITVPADTRTGDKGGVEVLDKLMKKKSAEFEMEKYSRASERLNLLLKGFEASVGGGAYRLDSTQMIQFLSLLINHEYRKGVSDISSILRSDFALSLSGVLSTDQGGYVWYGSKYHGIMSLRAYGRESQLPENSSPTMNMIFNHRDLSDIPFIIQHSLRLMSKSKGLSVAKGRRGRIAAQSAFAQRIKFLAKTPEGIHPDILLEMINEAISIVEGSNHKFVMQHFHVIMWEDALKSLADKMELTQSVIASSYKLMREKYNIKAAWLSMFPGNENVNDITAMIPSYNVGDFLPVDLPRINYNYKRGEMIYYKNQVEMVTEINLFDRRADNWNAIVCGGSGSGKSYLQNDILYQFSVYNPKIAIVDYGGMDAGSYRNFVINNAGTYLEINLDTVDFSVNPFDGQLYETDGSVNPWKLVSVMSAVERMISSSRPDQKLDEEVRYHLKEELLFYYKERNNNEGNVCNISEFAESHLNGNKAIVKIRDIYKYLFPFIGTGEKEGPYAKFFRSSQEVRSKDIVCFDMAGLKGHSQLKSVLVPTLLDMICNQVLAGGEKDRKRLLVMDEAWQDLKGGSMADFMEEMFRTIRKLNGSITVITQRLEDILDSNLAGALMANTSYYYFVGNKHNPVSLTKATASSAQGTIRLSEYDAETIINSQSKRDFFLLTPFFSGILRLYPSKEFRVLATTDPFEKGIIRKAMERLNVRYVTPEVVEAVKNEI